MQPHHKLHDTLGVRGFQWHAVFVTLQVRVDYLPSGPRSMTVKDLDAKSAGKFSFKPEGGAAITVEAYFQQTYGIKLQHPD
jgi:hypothetical protein